MKYCVLIILLAATLLAPAQRTTPPGISVIAYYAGDAQSINAYPVEKLTHIIFSFCHLKGNQLWVRNQKDSLTIQQLVALKQRNPSLKVLLSLGGWGGCQTCSEVFATRKGRKEFARSTRNLLHYFGADGIDLDWEYPAIAGFPDHRYAPEDKQNFTALIIQLHKKLKRKAELSFAAGGFTTFLAQSVEWNKVMPLVNRVNLMTYDLVHGASTVTGHHTPLYSTAEQLESTDHAVHYLDSIGVPKNKMVIGAAFYARVFDVATDEKNGLYQSGKFNRGLSFARLDMDSLQQEGFIYYWDDVAKAPYMYSANKNQLITFDDKKSIMLKTQYALDQGLEGIMFWQLREDKTEDGLLDAIDAALKE